MNIEIEKVSDDKTYRKVWHFWIDIRNEIVITLNFFAIQYRQTTRHKWIAKEFFDVFRPNSSNLGYEEIEAMKTSEEYKEVLQQAKQKLFDMIDKKISDISSKE